jgi:hypothetical protein
VSQKLALVDARQIAGQELWDNSCRDFSPLLFTGLLIIDDGTDKNTEISKRACV